MNRTLFEVMREMVYQLQDSDLASSAVIVEGAPIASFGRFTSSRIATLGLNPSNKEFFGTDGAELAGCNRRFHTLTSLQIDSWDDADDRHVKRILNSCEDYFLTNPYDRWFKSLNYLISGTGYSYYDLMHGACHLDLVPYATRDKWGNLSERQRRDLLRLGSRFLADIINASEIEVIVLNGKSVIQNLEKMTGTRLQCEPKESWNLPRKGQCVRGQAYTGTIAKLGDINLNRPVKALGFNHNIQSSFGVTSKVKEAIRDWLTLEVNRK